MAPTGSAGGTFKMLNADMSSCIFQFAGISSVGRAVTTDVSARKLHVGSGKEHSLGVLGCASVSVLSKHATVVHERDTSSHDLNTSLQRDDLQAHFFPVLPYQRLTMADIESNVRQALDKLLPKIRQRHQASSAPLIIGISGLQGSGKSTWASTVVKILSTEHQLHTITISLDDVYKTHDDLVKQRDKDPENKLYRTRGQPGTHDEQLAAEFFEQLKAYQGESILRIPSFDKSKFDGEGDRASKDVWPTTSSKPDVVVFEGWCLGFRPLTEAGVEEKYKLAAQGKMQLNTPYRHKLSHLYEMNDHLRDYCNDFMGPEHFDFFIHIDAIDLRYVYVWRMEQEHKMIAEKGMGMKDEEVEAFIDGYMPSYELYLDGLKEGTFFEDRGRLLSVQLNLQRGIERIQES